MKRSSPMKRSPMAPSKKRLISKSKFRRRALLNKFGKTHALRAAGNAGARSHYYANYGIADRPGFALCQSCGQPLHWTEASAHHKKQSGEAIVNKVVLCGPCHIVWVHDQERPGHRLAARLSPANVENGQIIDWKAFGLQEAFSAFRQGIPQPKGVKIPGKHSLCQGCREVEIPGSDLKQLNPCILHVDQVRAGIFGETA